MTDQTREGLSREGRIGVAAGLAAYTTWGVLPLFFRLYGDVPGVEILAHRVLWAIVLLAVVLAFRRQLTAALRLPWSMLAMLLGSTVVIGGNWLLYIYSVTHGHVGEASLGYYLTPLFSVLLGLAFLGERLTKAQVVAVAVVALGVGVIAWEMGGVPVISLTLMASFGLYGLIRKVVAVDALVGLFVETMVLAPPLLVYVALAEANVGGLRGHFLADGAFTTVLMVVSGPITIIPLLCFVVAARRLSLTTIGFLQYVAPTIQFGLALTVFGEPCSTGRLAGFLVIWAGLAVFLTDLALRRRRLAVSPVAQPSGPTDRPPPETLPVEPAAAPPRPSAREPDFVAAGTAGRP